MTHYGARCLLAWIGRTDLRAAEGDPSAGLGPIAQAASARQFDEIHLLSDHARQEGDRFSRWLAGHTSASIMIHGAKLTSPVNFGEIYEAAVTVLANLVKREPTPKFVYHLSPGTPAMAAVWIIISKTRFAGELIESSVERGVRTTSVPFDISAEFIPDLLRKPDEQLRDLAAGLPADAPEFSEIVHRSQSMRDVIGYARKVAVRSIPVLIQGESGTGKELLARAIHAASPRSTKPFVAVNCGAIPSELVESEFFGHKRGSFTGAVADRAGHFERANAGTLFLDEVGELPKAVQVKLLRALQEAEVTRVGETESRKVNVRVIAATNRNLIREVAAGAFREDLFYRLAVAVIQLPPLRERQGDLGLLIDKLLAEVNERAREEPGFKQKQISAGGRNILMRHSWPGNVRELVNTLLRAAVRSEDETISAEDMRAAMLEVPGTRSSADRILGQPIEEGVNLQEVIASVARHYLKEALEASKGNKTRAASLVGFSNYQTLTNWLRKYGLEK